MHAIPIGKRALLLSRLDAIGASIAREPGALALLGLGSCGEESDRLDDYSDLDFFVVVRAGHKSRFLDTLDWLTRVSPTAWFFRNTADGYKLLFADGVFCEFAVFEPDELASIPFAPGRLVWQRAGSPPIPTRPVCATESGVSVSEEWLLGEALTNLYVGLSRHARGEKLSAMRFVQQYAVDRALDLLAGPPRPDDSTRDPFAPDRRVEQRLPQAGALLPAFAQGYDRTPESAAALLDFLCSRYPVNIAVAAAIRALIAPPRA